MNSDIYSSVLTNKKLIILLLDNGGFAVINKLQNNTGNQSYNNLFCDTPTITRPFEVDFVSHARAMGANALSVENLDQLQEAFKEAKRADKTSLIVMKVDAYEGWTSEGHAWWEVGTPHISDSPSVTQAHKEWEANRCAQRKGV